MSEDKNMSVKVNLVRESSSFLFLPSSLPITHVFCLIFFFLIPHNSLQGSRPIKMKNIMIRKIKSTFGIKKKAETFHDPLIRSWLVAAK